MKNIEDRLRKNKGCFTVASWNRACRVKKDAPEIRKITTMEVVRTGVNYENLKIVKEKRESGELPPENTGLPEWAKWEEFPIIGKHKYNGQRYARIYPRSKAKKEVKYVVGGKEVPFSDVKKHLLSIETKEDDAICKWVKIEDLIEIK